MSKESLLEKFNKHVLNFFQNSAEGEEKPTPEEAPKAEEEKIEDVIVEKPVETQEVEKVEEPQPEVLTEEKIDSLKKEFVNAERKRIQEIENIANTIDADLVNEAKYGDSACDAKELALRAMQRENTKNQNALEALKKDNEASKVNEVEAATAPQDPNTDEQSTKEQAKQIVNAIKLKISKAKEGK